MAMPSSTNNTDADLARVALAAARADLAQKAAADFARACLAGANLPIKAPPATIDELLAAGATIATLANPGRDLVNLVSDFREIALTLKCLGDGLATAEDRAEETRDRRYDALSHQRTAFFSDSRTICSADMPFL